MNARPYLICLSFYLSQTAFAAENATLLKTAELRDKPFNDARVLTRLGAKSNVSILQRKGAWAQVQTGKTNGWVKLLSLVTLSGKRGDSGLASVNKTFQTGSTSQETTTGVKGFIAEKMEAFKKATPDYPEMKELDRQAVSVRNAAQFAAELKLAPRKIDYLPEPSREDAR